MGLAGPWHSAARFEGRLAKKGLGGRVEARLVPRVWGGLCPLDSGLGL